MTDYPNIAIMGKAGSGKTTFAEMLPVDYMVRSFAGPVKRIVGEIWGNKFAPDRDLMQQFGQAVRAIDEDAWVKMAGRLGFEPPVVFDDVRFPNEYWKLKEFGFVMVRVIAHPSDRLVRLQSNGKLQNLAQLNDISETALDDNDTYRADHTVFNSAGFDDLQQQVEMVLNKSKVRT